MGKIPKLRFKEFTDTWKSHGLGNSLVVKHGKSQKNVEDDRGEYPILATGGVIGKTNKPLYSKPSVLIGRKGTIDRPRYMETPFWTVDTLFYSEIKNDNVAKFIFYQFQQINWKKYNESTGVPSLSASTIMGIKVSTPSLQEQQKIADFLSTIDKKIELLEQKKKAFEKYKKGVMQAIFSQKIRFKKPDGSDYHVWVITALGQTAHFTNGYAFSSSTYDDTGKYLLVTISNVQNGYVVLQKANRINNLPTDLQYQQQLRTGDILLSMTGNVGRVAQITQNNCLLNQRVGKLTPKKNVAQKFLFIILNNEKFLTQMISFAQGGAQGNISKKDILRYTFSLPCRGEQIRISAIFSILQQKADSIKEVTDNMKIFKKALLQQMFV